MMKTTRIARLMTKKVVDHTAVDGCVFICPLLITFLVLLSMYDNDADIIHVLLISSFLLQCGVPKKGHQCPYQPKLKRRPDEPPPQVRNASCQVEMDEFMVLRRLNIEIQGFPESYCSEPYLTEDRVGAERFESPHPEMGKMATSVTSGTMTDA